MIVYALSCHSGHDFEGWYASPAAFDTLRDAGHVECPVCATKQVRKRPSAPYVHTSAPSQSTALSPEQRAQALGQLRTFILANTEDVGRRFAEVARRIHSGEEEHRGIRGQVTAEEAISLREEGVPAIAVSPDVALDEVTH